MSVKYHCLSILLFCVSLPGSFLLGADALPGATPWRTQWDDAAATAVDLSHLNRGPLTAEDRISARDGHFYNQRGERVRFLGVNIVWSACFPDKADAPAIARKLRKLGINLVRMHDMDQYPAPRGLLDGGVAGNRSLSAQELDLLDYFIYQLGEQGIYTDINLFVNRQLWDSGQPGSQWELSHGAKRASVYFYPPYVELQHEYARDLLTHYNPYTKARYADDPAIALVELVNERSLVAQNSGDVLQNLPAPLLQPLLAGWNEFLCAKYGTTAKLEDAWFGKMNQVPAGGNIIRNADFEKGSADWILQANSPRIAASMETLTGATDGSAPGRLAKISIHKEESSYDWHLQLLQVGLNLEPDSVYTLTFRAKADAARVIGIGLSQDVSPWKVVSPAQSIRLSQSWENITVVFHTAETLKDHSRLGFLLGKNPNGIFLADIVLHKGASGGLAQGESLEKKNVALPRNSTTPAGQDAVAYLSEVEVDFMSAMRDFLHNELGVKQPVVGSQAHMGGLTGVWRESGMDAVDMHGYWFHPIYNKDKKGIIDDRNNPVVAKLHGASADRAVSTISFFAAHRVAGKPYVVTEFNSSIPNEFRFEALAIMAAYAAWQDWDALVLFDYNSRKEFYKTDDAPRGYFRMQMDPAILAMMPVAAHLIRRGDLPEAGVERVLRIPKSDYPRLAASFADTWKGMTDLWNSFNQNSQSLNSSRWAVAFTDEGTPGVVTNGSATPADVLPLQWKTDGKGSAIFTVNSPASKALVVRYLAEGWQSVSVPGFDVSFGPSRHRFAVAALTSIDGMPIATARTSVLTLAGYVANTGFEWEPDGGIKNWGEAPVLVEAVEARVSLKRDTPARVYALDSTGARIGQIDAQWEQGTLRFTLNGDSTAVWYEIDAK